MKTERLLRGHGEAGSSVGWFVLHMSNKGEKSESELMLQRGEQDPARNVKGRLTRLKGHRSFFSRQILRKPLFLATRRVSGLTSAGGLDVTLLYFNVGFRYSE